MILRCAHCRTRFAADDAHKGKTFRCRVCASPIKSDAADAEVGADSRAAFAATEPSPTPQPQQKVASVAPPPAAAVARRNERSKRDLFGGQVELSSKVVEHHESPFTAARNENSVLFSLDQLSKPPVRANDDVVFSSKSAASAQGGGAAKKEDSGLIDLNRMMNDEKLSAKSVRPSPISEAPLGYVREVSHTPIPTVYEPNPFASASKRKKTGLIAGIAAAAVFAFAGIGVVANNHEDARVKAAAAAVAAPPPPPVVVAAPEPPPAPVVTTNAKAPDVTSDEKPETKWSGRSSGKSRKGAKGSAKASAGSSASAPAAPAAPKKAADPCGCHGDLLCNMKCSSH